jgi:uncharacterized protein YggE
VGAAFSKEFGMSRRFVLLATVLGVLIVTSSASAAPQPTQQAQTITATGTGQTRVVPKNRHNNASIVAAVNSARQASIAGALREAREYALSYAKAVGLKLGTVMTVSDVQSNGYFGPRRNRHVACCESFLAPTAVGKR